MIEYFLSTSSNPDKKYMVQFLNPSTNNFNTIHFGQNGYDDFILSNNLERKRLYKIRHRNDKINDLSFAGCWSWWLLWNKPTLYDSILDMEWFFSITITLI